MPRDDFVQACIDTVETIPRVTDSSISGRTIQYFVMKQRPVLYNVFCSNMVGQQALGTGKSVKELVDIDSRFILSVLDEQNNVKETQGEFSVNDAYLTLKTVHDFAMDPDGERVANYLTLIAKCLYIANKINNTPFTAELNKFFNSCTAGALETCTNFIESLSIKDDAAMQILAVLSDQGRMSTWRDKDRYYQLIPNLTEETHRYCTAEQKKANFPVSDLAKWFREPQIQGGELSTAQQFYKNCGNSGITPYWLFFDRAQGAPNTLVDVKSLTTCGPFNQLYKLASSPNTRVREKLLRYPWMRKSWNTMSTIIIINDPFTAQKSDFVKKNTMKYWSNPLSRKDFNRSNEVMANFVDEIRVRKLKITEELCKTFVKFLTDISKAVAPIPGLEKQPTREEDEARYKIALQQRIEDDGPSINEIEKQLEERRIQLQKFSKEEKKDDSGVMLPVLLLGLGIFLFSR